MKVPFDSSQERKVSEEEGDMARVLRERRKGRKRIGELTTLRRHGDQPFQPCDRDFCEGTRR